MIVVCTGRKNLTRQTEKEQKRGHSTFPIARVNRPMTEKELAAIRHCIRRGTPFGTKAWTSNAAEKLGIESSLRPQGRPRKIQSPEKVE